MWLSRGYGATSRSTNEVLKLFVGYGSHAWLEDFEPVLASAKGRTVSVRVDGGGPGWLVRTETDGVEVTDAATAGGLGGAVGSVGDAAVNGAAVPVLRWLWARESSPTADAAPTVRVQGDEEAVAEFRRLLAAATQ